MIQIVYNPTSLQDFKDAVLFAREQGGQVAPVSVRPSAQKEEENGPYVKQFLQSKGQERFRLTADERDLMALNGYSREDIAKIRLGLFMPDEVSPSDVETPVESIGFNSFFPSGEDEDEDEEQQRRDEKNGLYGGREDSAN
jgi:hypothetical protein